MRAIQICESGRHDRKLQGGTCHEQPRLHTSSQSAQYCDSLPELLEHSWARAVVRELRAERAVRIRDSGRTAQADAWRCIDLALPGGDMERESPFAVTQRAGSLSITTKPCGGIVRGSDPPERCWIWAAGNLAAERRISICATVG